jgi:uncharacterized protein
MNVSAAVSYAHDKLVHDLPANLLYHGTHHTRDDVVPAAKRLANAYKLSKDGQALLLTAAWYHDIGFTVRYDKNEAIGARIAAEALPRFGYTFEQIQMIVGIILATRPPQDPKTLLEAIMVDADLDSLGRDDFIAVAKTLREEEAIYKNITRTESQWYWEEMNFLRDHRYFTDIQRRYRTVGKLKNFMRLHQHYRRQRSRR